MSPPDDWARSIFSDCALMATALLATYLMFDYGAETNTRHLASSLRRILARMPVRLHHIEQLLALGGRAARGGQDVS